MSKRKVTKECVLCYEEKEIFIMLACEHPQCTECFAKLSKTGKVTCPMCRNEAILSKRKKTNIYQHEQVSIPLPALQQTPAPPQVSTPRQMPAPRQSPARPQVSIPRQSSVPIEELTFGKHRGIRIDEVYKRDPSYCQWMIQSIGDLNVRYPGIYNYLVELNVR